jgi:hypothetical protein
VRPRFGLPPSAYDAGLDILERRDVNHGREHTSEGDGGGAEPLHPEHAPGIGDPKLSDHTDTYDRMPTWALRAVAYHAGHDPDNDIWRDMSTGRSIADSADDAAELEETGTSVYRALSARIHNLVLDILDEAGREDDHGREPRSISDDAPILGLGRE